MFGGAPIVVWRSRLVDRRPRFLPDVRWQRKGESSARPPGSADVAPKIYPALSSFWRLVKRYPFLGQPKLEFSGVKANAGRVAGGPFISAIGGLLPMALCGRNSL